MSLQLGRVLSSFLFRPRRSPSGPWRVPLQTTALTIYKLKIYTKQIDGFYTVYVIVVVNTKLLEEMVRSGINIPNIDFLKLSCRYHLAYT
jgi:hypothetical protein